MKVAILLLALTATNTLHLADVGTEMTISEHHSVVFTAPQEANPYDKCFHYIDDISHLIQDLVEIIRDKQFNRIPQKLIRIATTFQLAVDCFTHPEAFAANFGIDPQCVIAHLKKAGVKVQEIVYDVTHRHIEEAKMHVRELLTILRDIPKNCQ